jgi:hypothetical protein
MKKNAQKECNADLKSNIQMKLHISTKSRECYDNLEATLIFIASEYPGRLASSKGRIHNK